MTQGLILTSKLHIKYWHSPINAVNVDKHKKNTESKKPHKPTMWDLCTIDWPKEDAANFESQNFEGP